jgi:hypothetical protein
MYAVTEYAAMQYYRKAVTISPTVEQANREELSLELHTGIFV